MTDKQTICPTCKTTYKVSVPQLTVAQGMVCCPKCETNFNALLNLLQSGQHSPNVPTAKLTQSHHDTNEPSDSIHSEESIASQQASTMQAESAIYADQTFSSPQASASRPIYHETSRLDIFDRKVENSNIDLRTYLNSLNQFNHDPLTSIPSLNLSAGHNYHQEERFESRKTLYYFCWSLVNIALVLVLVFQILWFNPALLDKHPALHAAFDTTCNILNCDTIDDRYKQIHVEKFKIEKISKHKTQFSGSLVNTYKKSLAVPIIKVTLKAGNETIHTQMITANDYLKDSLNGISRIPSNTPYKFEFTIDKSRNAFDDYSVEIIHP